MNKEIPASVGAKLLDINRTSIYYKSFAKYSCGFSNFLDSSIIVNER